MLLAPKYKFGLVKNFTVKNTIQIQGYHGPATHNPQYFIYIHVCKI